MIHKARVEKEKGPSWIDIVNVLIVACSLIDDRRDRVHRQISMTETKRVRCELEGAQVSNIASLLASPSSIPD
jgi:hypothetical protein